MWFNLLPIYSDLKSKKQIITDQDLASAVLNTLKIEKSIGKTYQIGGPHIYTMEEVLEIF